MTDGLRSTHLPAIIAALAVALAPHVPRLPVLIVLWCVVLWGYILLARRKGLKPPRRSFLLLLTVLGFFLAVVSFGRRPGTAVYTGLLAVMATLKPFEMRTHRDEMVTTFLAYFIVITSLFAYETLAMTLYMLLSVLVTTSVLIRINNPGGRLRGQVRLAARIMAQALPITIILFFLFPRIQGSIWGVQRETTARSGFSTTLSPGSVTRLVQDERIAFRAEFQGSVPPRNLRYWRGLVFTEFDGRSWSWKFRVPPPIPNLAGDRPYTYTVSMEPHDERWLFSLDLPAETPPNVYILNDYTLRVRRPVRRKRQYSLTSLTRYNTGPLRRPEEIHLSLPSAGNPRTRELAARWLETRGTPEGVVTAALAYFRENDFYYTLSPPPLGRNSIDDFLLETRRGYCEHYASAFGFLMRSAGIPARLVGGYQGGEKNPYGNHLTVRQADAHTWAEVWLEGAGWRRVDPTAAIAPERIESGVAAALDEAEVPDFLRGAGEGLLQGFGERIRYGWDLVNTQWDLYFAGYSFEEQRSFLQRLGFETDSWKGPAKGLLAGFAGAGLLGFVFALRIFRRPRERGDPVREAYQRLCHKLERAGIAREPAQGPADFRAKVARERPDLAGPVGEIMERYIRIRYGGMGSEEEIRSFLQSIRDFRPERQRAP